MNIGFGLGACQSDHRIRTRGSKGFLVANVIENMAVQRAHGEKGFM